MTDGTENTIDPTAEEDLAGAGWKVERTVFTAVKVETKQATDKNGSGTQALITWQALVGNRKEEVTQRVWLTHTDEATANRAAGDRKRLYIAVFGGPKGNIAGIQGRQVSAEGNEDDSGFRKIRGFRKVDGGVAAAPMAEAAGL